MFVRSAIIFIFRFLGRIFPKLYGCFVLVCFCFSLLCLWFCIWSCYKIRLTSRLLRLGPIWGLQREILAQHSAIKAKLEACYWPYKSHPHPQQLVAFDSIVYTAFYADIGAGRAIQFLHVSIRSLFALTKHHLDKSLLLQTGFVSVFKLLLHIVCGKLLFYLHYVLFKDFLNCRIVMISDVLKIHAWHVKWIYQFRWKSGTNKASES